MFSKIDVNGANGYWFGGTAHEFVYLDRRGEYQQDRARLAGNTLVWTRGNYTYLLEGPTLSRDAALKLALSLRYPGKG